MVCVARCWHRGACEAVTEDVSLLQHQKKLAMIMKDGRLHKDPRSAAVGGGLIQAA